jgi:hypothetical protein
LTANESVRVHGLRRLNSDLSRCQQVPFPNWRGKELEHFSQPRILLLPAAMQVLYLITGQSREGLAFFSERTLVFELALYQKRTTKTG